MSFSATALQSSGASFQALFGETAVSTLLDQPGISAAITQARANGVSDSTIFKTIFDWVIANLPTILANLQNIPAIIAMAQQVIDAILKLFTPPAPTPTP